MNSKKNARHGSLVCLIQALVGLDTTVELRYERSVRGTIAHVDDHMNIQMTGVVCHSLHGPPQSFSSMFISGNQIRYVHIPKNVNAIDAITNKTSQSINHLSGAECLNEEKKNCKRRKQKLEQRSLAVEEEIYHQMHKLLFEISSLVQQVRKTGVEYP
ncbi:U7 snRNA-associated Sm-like protein LSm10 isoform X1 [Dysidea avara]|uniref:U7 snRNA-associated Sm-like protein LSm10 isoform X1 n=1 Tax=Dysidea avara TaxID=196820 RepID=UPI003331D8F9